VIYNYAGQAEVPPTIDWDGIMFVEKKIDIANLLNNCRHKLFEMFDITREEFPALRVPEASSRTWSSFDAVRFVGFTRDATRKSIKIMSMEYWEESRTSLNVLSFKDRRLFESYSSEGSLQYRIQQATRLGNDLIILHDEWIFRADQNFCLHGNDKAGMAFGITTDLLMTGVWLHGEAIGRRVQRLVLERFNAHSGTYVSTESFARSFRFQREYRQFLSGRLEELHASISSLKSCFCSSRSSIYLYGTTRSAFSELSSDSKSRMHFLPAECRNLRLSLQERSLKDDESRSAFSSNSVNGRVTMSTDTPGSAATVDLFWKVSPFQDQELSASTHAASFYPNIQVPVVAASGELLYPLFVGRTEAEHRLSFIKGGRKCWETVEIILHTELRRAEDMLRAYRQSFRPVAISGTHQPIHRFFHSRLIENKRFGEFYGAGITIHHQHVSTSMFCDMPLRINGKEYMSLNQLAQAAARVLDPAVLSSCPVAFGLGDSHGANIMVGETKRPAGDRELLYIDYEVAGYHPPMLDLAKAFHHDVFFEMLYADETPYAVDVDYFLHNGVVTVNVRTCNDHLSRAILAIKRRYLVEPLLDEFNDLHNHVSQLSSGLFACSLLTRNLSDKWDAFFGNMAVGVALSQAKDLGELWDCCALLVGDADGGVTDIPPQNTSRTKTRDFVICTRT
jgi:hypothetical protein